ncbi:four helix bundle protein [Nitratifractor sp.]|uniref:four helix bundle protein n=1 Tax=Nitratifractor sp. TaxID=2268144 RepID=UPI0025CFDD9C|nr:four helix bundle protein [Nitratifractor sp.]
MRNEEPKRDDPLSEKSFTFALRIVKLNNYLRKKHKEYILSKQVLRSGTSIGALIAEGKYAQSKADFLNKLMIALKEASETEYWIRLLFNAGYIDEKMFASLDRDIDELLRLLIASTKTVKHS